MKITATQLRALIKEAISKGGYERPDVEPSDDMILSDLKDLSMNAFNAYRNYLVEDCQDTFTALGDGRFSVKTTDGKTFYWDDEYSAGEWEEDMPSTHTAPARINPGTDRVMKSRPRDDDR